MALRNPAFNGVPYHQRWQMAIDAGCVLDIVVTDPADMTFIANGSGIVVAPRWHDGAVEGRLPEAPRTVVYFEGWVHGANQYSDLPARGRWEAAVFHAAGRAVTEYPTTASAFLPTGHLRVVGRYHTRRGEAAGAFEITDPATLEAWLAGGGPGSA